MRRLIFSVFVLAFALVLSGCGTSLVLKSDPTGADVIMLNSGIKAKTDSRLSIPDDLFDASGRTYDERLLYKKDGFRDKERDITLKKRKINKAPVERLEKLDTVLIVKSTPEGAYVEFNLGEDDNMPPGWKKTFVTPVEFKFTTREAINIPDEFAIVEVRKEGFEIDTRYVLEFSINLPPGEKTVIDIPLRPLVTTLKVITNPEGAVVEDISQGGFGYLGETPLIRNFNWEDIVFWAEKVRVDRKKSAFNALIMTLRITKVKYEDTFLRNIKMPIGEERTFHKNLMPVSGTITFASDPMGAHVYVIREEIREIYDEAENIFKSVTVDYKKHIGSTPFTYNVDSSDPIVHGEALLLEMSGYKPATLMFAAGQKNYHIVLEPLMVAPR